MASSLVNNKYRITRRIGGGSFGEIYMGIGPNNEKVAVKFERHGTRCPQLRHEYKVYRELTNCHGFCSVYHFGTQDIYNVMVMDLLGPSLEDLFNKCSRRFTLKTVLQIADQLLERVDTLHSRHLIHRDIKPANFVIGVGDQGANVYCVDFGLSKRYRHPKNLQHIPHRDGRSLTGTPRYASINNHLGIEQSRRDDLESIGYVLIYFLKGTLPWQGLKAKNAQKKYRMILEKKQQVSIAHLCQGCPSQFAEFLSYTRSLKFDAKPDIPYLRKLFRDMYHAQGCASMGKLWDWDSIDAEFTIDGAAAQAPNISANPPRPSTAAAVAAVGTGIDSDAALLVGDGYEQSGQGGAGNRPSTAGPVGQRQAAPQASGQNWQNTDRGGQGHQQQQSIQRPHTAGARQAQGQQGYSAQHQVQMDPRTGKAVGAEEEEEGDDAHVVAGARAMMRYRRTRASSTEGSGGQQQTAPGHSGPGATAAGQKAGWSGGQEQVTYGQGQPRAIYQNPNKVSTSQQQQQLMQQQQMTRAKSSSGQRSSSQQQQQQNGTGWMAGGAAAQSGSTAESRPKSAGIMSSLTGSNRQGSSTQQQGQAQQQPQQTMSYGTLRSRFLSGGGNGQKPAETSNGGSGKGNSQASKLFSISR